MLDQIKEFLTARAQAYRHTFTGVHGEKVLVDLAACCRARESTFHPAPRLAGLRPGRREGWLRITKHLNLTEDQLVEYFNPQGGE